MNRHSFRRSCMEESYKRFIVTKVSERGREAEEAFIIAERPITLFLNGREVVTLLATPDHLEELAAGYLLSEGLIREQGPVRRIAVDPEGMVRVEVSGRGPLAAKLFQKRTITSGCGRGTIFYSVLDSLGARKILSPARISEEQILRLMKELNQRSVLYRMSGSVHGAALADRRKIRIFHQDIGRHNAVDKVLGAAYLQGLSPAGKVLLTSGRISSEVLVKAVKRRVPFLISYSGPTDLAVEMARKLGITLVGYVRGNRMRIYSHSERVTR